MKYFFSLTTTTTGLWSLGLFVTAMAEQNGSADNQKNMNPRPYKIANSASFDTDGPPADAAYFDVYSPVIRTLYSEVYWTMQEPVELPTEIVQEFADGKVMAIVGYEVDQVRVNNKQGKEVSVPITWSYNHHYMAWLMQRSPELDQELRLHHHNRHHAWGTEQPYPKATLFSEGNGGEFRGSYHNYPAGHAQLVQSPTHFQFNPMSIDTWNRSATSDDDDNNNNDDARFHPGPLPASSRIPPSAGYSGLIECPCPDKFVKEWHMAYQFGRDDDDSPYYEGPIANATECLAAAQSLVPSQSYKLVTEASHDGNEHPTCSLAQHVDGSVDVYWKVDTQHDDETNQQPDNYQATTMDNDQDSTMVAYSSTLVNVTVVQGSLVQMTLTGPADKWFGVGIGSNSMCLHQVGDECPSRGPYAIIVSGSDIVERKLDQHGPGAVLAPSVMVESNTVNGGNRTVVLSRPLEGLTDDHYTFDPETTSIPLIVARGCSLEFAQHCGHGAAQLDFLMVNQVTPVTRAGVQGNIGGQAFVNKGRCAPQPIGDLIAQHNPTCRVETYQGGMACCHHGHTLLDAHQEQPWPDQYLEMRFKFRFYYQEYKPAASADQPASHRKLTRLYWETETYASEYDIPQCAATTPPDQCVHSITSHFTARGLFTFCGEPIPEGTTGVELIYAGPHCHAPACLSMELYNADTGELLCHGEPIFGQSGQLYDETGFVAIPPCLWGSPEEGLMPPPYLSLDTNLFCIKRNNNTLPHTGEMASWQMRGVAIIDETKQADKKFPKVVSRTSLRGVDNGV